MTKTIISTVISVVDIFKFLKSQVIWGNLSEDIKKIAVFGSYSTFGRLGTNFKYPGLRPQRNTKSALN